MTESHILRPFNSPRDVYSPRTVLVVASEGSLDFPEDLKAITEGSSGLNVHYAKRLPLPCGDNHPPIDAVVFVYKVLNKPSLDTIRESMAHLDVRYLAGKCFILVYSDCKYSLDDLKEIEDFAGSFNLPLHNAYKEKATLNGKSRLHLPSELMSVYCPHVGSDVDSLIVDAVMSYNSIRSDSGNKSLQASAAS